MISRKITWSARITCDRCEAVEDVFSDVDSKDFAQIEHKALGKWGKVRGYSLSNSMSAPFIGNNGEGRDLCPRCRDELDKWFYNPTCKVLVAVEDEA